MSEFYKFAGEHPFLTFFLFSIVANMVVGLAKAVRGIK